MLGICCVGVGKCQSEDSFVCFGMKPKQRACSQDFQRDRKRMREGRPKSQQKWTEETRAENRSVDRTGQELEPVDTGWIDQREKMSQHSKWLCGSFTRIHTRDSSQNARKVSQTSSFLCLELTQVRVCLFSFLPPSRLCCKIIKFP